MARLARRKAGKGGHRSPGLRRRGLELRRYLFPAFPVLFASGPVFWEAGPVFSMAAHPITAGLSAFARLVARAARPSRGKPNPPMRKAA